MLSPRQQEELLAGNSGSPQVRFDQTDTDFSMPRNDDWPPDAGFGVSHVVTVDALQLKTGAPFKHTDQIMPGHGGNS